MRMRPRSVCGGIAAGALLFLGAFGAVLAQGEPQGDEADNPPGRVARLSDIEGSVSVEPAGTSLWTSAILNRPVTLGDKLWADQSSRAELDIGDAAIRLGSTTGFSFLNLDQQTAQMQVTAGTVIVHVRAPWAGQHYEIDTPNLALTLERTGTYRVEVSDTGDTTIVKVVARGEALATSEGGQYYRVAAQQIATFTGTTRLTADYARLGAPDWLDEWALQREQQEQQEAALAQQYLPPEMVGADDLGSDDGTWEDTPDWGYAWFPDVAEGWAPYTVGSWAWVSPWGWTWVDEEPWGFAPFHYGRWGHSGSRWCWIPGPRGGRPIYAPALVGWVGGGRHAGVPSSAGANVGWFPLGPRDVYVPGYHATPAYVRQINLTNSRKVDATYVTSVYAGRVRDLRYVNSAVPGGVTMVSADVLTSAQFVGPHRLLLPHQGVASLQPTTMGPAITPVEQSVLGANAGRVVMVPPGAIVARPVVARLAPPRAPVAFATEQAAIRANGGQLLPMTELARMRPNTPAAPVRLESPAKYYYYRATPADAAVWAHERASRQSTLPQAPAAVRNDGPPRVQQGQPASEQRFLAPKRRVAQQRFASPKRQVPQPHFVRSHFAPPRERQGPQQRGYNPAHEEARPSGPRPASAPPPARIAGRPPA